MTDFESLTPRARDDSASPRNNPDMGGVGPDSTGDLCPDYALSEEDHSPRTFPPKLTRANKRANSSTSTSQRSKFRSNLDTFDLYPDAENPFEDDIADSNYTAATPQTFRQNSNASVTAGGPTDKKTSPLYYLGDNPDLDPLFPIKLITQNQMKAIMNMHYSQPLPDCDLVFPWLHGIHHSNSNQRDFLHSLANFTTVDRDNFDIFKQSSKIPAHYRGLIPVQSTPTGDGPVSGILKGSISVDEILEPLEVSKEDLLEILSDFLKDLSFVKDASQHQSILETLFKDCLKLKALPIFKNLDPQRGISLRNFHIQVSKVAQISDFIVYCFRVNHLSKDSPCQCEAVARLLYFAQLRHAVDNPELVDLLCSTLLLKENSTSFYQSRENSRLLALDVLTESDTRLIQGNICTRADLKLFNSWENNYLLREKFEISKMSSATETLANVWVGNNTNYETLRTKGFINPHKRAEVEPPLYIDPKNSTLLVTHEQIMEHGEDLLINPAAANWKLFVSCSEGAIFPSVNTLRELLSKEYVNEHGIFLEFPPSGSIGMGDCTDTDLIAIINMCKVIYMRSSTKEPSLLYCSDGYTESSLLVVLFMIYATGETLSEVALKLHKHYGRPFFLFPTDVQLISKIEDILIHYSPVNSNLSGPNDLEILSDAIIYKYLFTSKERNWFVQINGSLPSRVLPHLYLGSLNHANEFELLRELNIKRIVSVGENLTWLDRQEYTYRVQREVVNPNITILRNFEGNCPVTELMSVNNVQDDGIDMLTHNLQDILNFIDTGYENNEPVLVHCRVGVSRSATVCIAEVMKRLRINLIKAYIFVRVRRLNIIIQPNLRFMYELVKWEESERLKLRKNDKSQPAKEMVKTLGSPMKSDFEGDDGDYEGDKTQVDKTNMTLSGSIGSILSDYSDLTEVSVSNILEFGCTVPLRQVKPSSSPIHSKIEISSKGADDSFDDECEKEDLWLRDVDWHILCREVDFLNKVYIRG